MCITRFKELYNFFHTSHQTYFLQPNVMFAPMNFLDAISAPTKTERVFHFRRKTRCDFTVKYWLSNWHENKLIIGQRIRIIRFVELFAGLKRSRSAKFQAQMPINVIFDHDLWIVLILRFQFFLFPSKRRNRNDIHCFFELESWISILLYYYCTHSMH